VALQRHVVHCNARDRDVGNDNVHKRNVCKRSHCLRQLPSLLINLESDDLFEVPHKRSSILSNVRNLQSLLIG
jgi:hypothetical protein